MENNAKEWKIRHKLLNNLLKTFKIISLKSIILRNCTLQKFTRFVLSNCCQLVLFKLLIRIIKDTNKSYQLKNCMLNSLHAKDQHQNNKYETNNNKQLSNINLILSLF